MQSAKKWYNEAGGQRSVVCGQLLLQPQSIGYTHRRPHDLRRRYRHRWGLHGRRDREDDHEPIDEVRM